MARGPGTGDLGVAVQSRYFTVGPIVPWAEAGVGAVATQAMGEPAHGYRGLALMRSGLAAPEALAAVLAPDERSASRQVALVDAQGRVAVHTGDRCIADAGHMQGDGFSVQANMMRSDTVWPAMASAFSAATGSLAERLLAALDAAEAEGGDFRGRQSVALVVVPSEGPPWERKVDLRVEDDPEPLVEMRRLLAVHDENRRAGEAGGLLLKGDAAAALELLEGGDDPNSVFYRALALVVAGRADEGRTLLATLAVTRPGWELMVPRLAAAGLLPQALADELSAQL